MHGFFRGVFSELETSWVKETVVFQRLSAVVEQRRPCTARTSGPLRRHESGDSGEHECAAVCAHSDSGPVGTRAHARKEKKEAVAMAAVEKSGTVRAVQGPVQTSGRRASEAQMAPRTNSLQVVGEKYRVLKKIGEGSFGVIHEGLCGGETAGTGRESMVCWLGRLRVPHGLANGFGVRVCRSRAEHGNQRARGDQVCTWSLFFPFEPRPHASHDFCSSLRVSLRVQEAKKSEAPQLRDEYKNYQIMAGCGTSNRIRSAVIRCRAY